MESQLPGTQHGLRSGQTKHVDLRRAGCGRSHILEQVDGMTVSRQYSNIAVG